MVVYITNTSIPRDHLQAVFPQFQKTPTKPHKTRRFTLTGPSFRLRYAQHTKIHSNAFDRGLGSPNFLSVAGKQGCAESELCGRGKQYGRLAGSDEHSPGFAVPGSQSGHALQVRE